MPGSFYPKQILTAADLNAATAAAPENITVPMAAADVKLAPVAADMVPIRDSQAAGALKQVSVDALRTAFAPAAVNVPYTPPGAGAYGSNVQKALEAARSPFLNDIVTCSDWDDFDAPDGTLLNGRVMPSGNTWVVSGPGGSAINITNKKLSGETNSGNFYAQIHTRVGNPSVSRAEAVISFASGGAGVGNGECTLILDGSGGSLTQMVHAYIGPTGLALTKKTVGTAQAFAGIPLSGDSEGQNGTGFSHKTDGTKYHWAIEIVGTTLYVYFPDGRVLTSSDAEFSSCVGTAVFQITGQAAVNGNFHAVSAGKSKADVASIMGQDRALAEMVYKDLFGNQGWQNNLPIAFVSQGAGWYTIATEVAPTVAHKIMSGIVEIFGLRAATGVSTAARANIGVDNGSSANVFTVDNLSGNWSGGIVDQVRLSQNTATKAIQLDIHLTSAAATDAVIYVRCRGSFTVNKAPTLGAVALANLNQTQTIFASSFFKSGRKVWADVANIFSSAGWWTIMSGSLQYQLYVGGEITMFVSDAAGRQEILKFSLQAQKGNTPTLIQRFGSGNWGTFPVYQVRLSVDDTNNLFQLDVNIANTPGKVVEMEYQVASPGGSFLDTPLSGATVLPTAAATLTVAMM